VRTLLAHRDARFYLAGQALSTVGDNAALTIAVTVPQTASIALGAALVAVVDYRFLLAVMAAVIVISVVYLIGGPDAVAPAGAAPVPVRDGRA
jgi:hypothetical protein